MIEERLEALQHFVRRSGLGFPDLESAVEATENFLIGHLKKLSQRIVYLARSRHNTNIDRNDIRDALHYFTPLCQSFCRSKKPIISWQDVGGLDAVKEALTEIFIWPSKYPNMFRNCPINIGRGVLLYGPTGCGKTLIAKAVAAESSLNLLQIKGPELLSKYIGQSEKNVRDLFERARLSKPSLILFDEFDSLGPKRGHDSTGVTDRVVNQLLTELDGLEEQEGGIYVIATTNRLDLIDPALIRPGRFDFMLNVSLPNEHERRAILEILTRKVLLEDNFLLSHIASRTEGWSGAALKGLATSAQFFATYSAAHSNGVLDRCGGPSDVKKLSLEHFNKAMKEVNWLGKSQTVRTVLETDSKITLA